MAEQLTKIEMAVQAVNVITVPIDDTLTTAGAAADAKAVGDALADKADRSELQNAVTVDGQGADAQGHILVYPEHIPMSGTDPTTLAAKITAIDGKTGQDIPVRSGSTQTIAEALEQTGNAQTAQTIPMSDASGAPTIAAMIASLFPVGAVYVSLNTTAPSFFGTWQEIKIVASWYDLKNGVRNYSDGTGTGGLHFWRRIS